MRESEDGSGAMVHVEDGFEFRHKKPENWSEKKKEQEMKEKLEVCFCFASRNPSSYKTCRVSRLSIKIAKKKRQVYERVLIAKPIAESNSDDEDAANWVAKVRKQEEERKRAEERVGGQSCFIASRCIAFPFRRKCLTPWMRNSA